MFCFNNGERIFNENIYISHTFTHILLQYTSQIIAPKLVQKTKPNMKLSIKGALMY